MRFIDKLKSKDEPITALGLFMFASFFTGGILGYCHLVLHFDAATLTSNLKGDLRLICDLLYFCYFCLAGGLFAAVTLTALLIGTCAALKLLYIMLLGVLRMPISRRKQSR